MPLTAAGKLNLVASADLRGLGARDGAPVPYEWVLPGVAPLVLPWLLILALLLFRANRSGAAWLIWLPLVIVSALNLAHLPSSPGDEFLDLVGALAIGLAAVWLLADYLRRRHRLLTFLCVLPVLAGFSGLGFACSQGASLLSAEGWALLIALGLGALVLSAALILTGWVCRIRYRPLALYAWLLPLLALLWLLLAAPFVGFAMLNAGGRIGWGDFFAPLLVVVAITFATLLPFLLLSSACPFFRQRLKTLLHVKAEAPPLVAPLVPTDLQVQSG